MASGEFITRPKSRQPHKLSARAVAVAKPGRHGDGAGLWLIVSPRGAKKWVFRFSWARRPTEMGLGGYPAVSLAEAREKAAGARKLASAGTNPIQARKAQASQARQTFGECALVLIAAKQFEWRNVKHRQQWRMTLEVFYGPCGRRGLKPHPAFAGASRRCSTRRRRKACGRARTLPGGAAIQALAGAREALTRSFCGHALFASPGLHGRAARAGSDGGAGSRIPDSDSGTLGRSSWRAVV
jgi:hypothetical protein